MFCRRPCTRGPPSFLYGHNQQSANITTASLATIFPRNIFYSTRFETSPLNLPHCHQHPTTKPLSTDIPISSLLLPHLCVHFISSIELKRTFYSTSCRGELCLVRSLLIYLLIIRRQQLSNVFGFRPKLPLVTTSLTTQR